MLYKTLTKEICERYSVNPDFPWAKYPDYAVFRHANNRKWFALLMPVTSTALGLPAQAELIHILNLKTRPELTGQLRMLPGFFPAYHMNKEHWVSVRIDTVTDELLWSLLDDSFSLTA